MLKHGCCFSQLVLWLGTCTYIYLHVYTLCWTWMYFLFEPSSLEFYTHCILLSARLGISRRGCSDRLGRWRCRFHCRYWECVSPLSEHLPRVWKTLLCPHLSVRRLLLPLRVAPCLLLVAIDFLELHLGSLGCFVHWGTSDLFWPPKDSVCYTEVGSGRWLCEVLLHCSGLLHCGYYCLAACLSVLGKFAQSFFLRLTVNRFVDIFCVSSKTVHSSYF